MSGGAARRGEGLEVEGGRGEEGWSEVAQVLQLKQPLLTHIQLGHLD